MTVLWSKMVTILAILLLVPEALGFHHPSAPLLLRSSTSPSASRTLLHPPSAWAPQHSRSQILMRATDTNSDGSSATGSSAAEPTGGLPRVASLLAAAVIGISSPSAQQSQQSQGGANNLGTGQSVTACAVQATVSVPSEPKVETRAVKCVKPVEDAKAYFQKDPVTSTAASLSVLAGGSVVLRFAGQGSGKKGTPSKSSDEEQKATPKSLPEEKASEAPAPPAETPEKTELQAMVQKSTIDSEKSNKPSIPPPLPGQPKEATVSPPKPPAVPESVKLEETKEENQVSTAEVMELREEKQSVKVAEPQEEKQVSAAEVKELKEEKQLTEATVGAGTADSPEAVATFAALGMVPFSVLLIQYSGIGSFFASWGILTVLAGLLGFAASRNQK